MVRNIQPVPSIVAIPIYGQGPVVDDVVDEQGDELFGELVGSVVVGTVADDKGKLIGFPIGPYKVIRTCLGGRIRRVGAIGGILSEKPCVSQGPIDLIGADIVEPEIGVVLE